MTSQERLDWLKGRQTGIGGSDVAAIIGLSRYKSPLDVYNSKVQPVTEEQSPAAYWGTQLEDIVAKEFQSRTGMKVQRVTQQLSKDGWMLANIDRAVVNPSISGTVRVQDEAKQAETGRMLTTDAILECKTASSYIADQWGDSQEAEIVSGNIVTEHKIPIYYETQVQWYMGVTGASRCYVAVLLGGQDFRIYAVNRDDDVIKALQDQCRKFWFEHVKTETPPEPRTKEEVVQLFTKDNGEMVEADNAVAADIGELRSLDARIKELKAEQDVIKDRVCAALGDRQGFLIGGEKACTFKTQSSSRFDTTLFKKEQPNVYAAYIKTTTSRVFRLTA